MDLKQAGSEGKQKTKTLLKTIFKYSNILGLFGIIVTIIIFFLAEKKKELTLTIDSFISLVDMTTLEESGITISFDSIPVDNLYKVNLSLENTGNSAITSEDFIKDMSIDFDSNAVLLKCELNSFPKTIDLNYKKSEKKIWLKPDLLNPGDRIIISSYYSVNNTSSLPTSTSRIVDGEIIIINVSEELKKPNKFIIPFSKKIENILVWIAIIWNLIFFLLIVWAIFFQQTSQKNGLFINFMAFTFIGIGFILTILYLLQSEFF